MPRVPDIVNGKQAGQLTGCQLHPQTKQHNPNSQPGIEKPSLNKSIWIKKNKTKCDPTVGCGYEVDLPELDSARPFDINDPCENKECQPGDVGQEEKIEPGTDKPASLVRTLH